MGDARCSSNEWKLWEPFHNFSHIPFPSQIAPSIPGIFHLIQIGIIASFLCSHPSRITHRGQGFPWRKERRRRGKAEKLLRSQKPISMTDCLARPTRLSGRTADYAHSQQEFGSSRSHAISYLPGLGRRREQETFPVVWWERERHLPSTFPGLRETRSKNIVPFPSHFLCNCQNHGQRTFQGRF